MSSREGPRIEQLEKRCLLAVRTVDFDNYPLVFNQYDWMLQNSHTPSSGFSYTIGTGDGQRPNINGITWPDATYYNTVLGSGGFSTVDGWNMKPVVLYTQAKSGGWLTQGWNYVPDMAEGAACIDDAGRAAVTYAEDYLLNGTASSYQTARDILTFVAYMTTRQGKVYNFAWLDAPATFAWDPIYSQDKHFEYRSEYVKRTAYPSASPNSSWFDQNSDIAHIIDWPNPVRANPFISHPKYSVYIDDLRDASNNDVATVYDGPLYSNAGGGPTSFKTGIRKTWTNSTQAFGFDEGRALLALSKGLMMMQKREAEVGSLSADELSFAQFLENNTYRLVRNAQVNAGGVDSKLGSAMLYALDDYYQLFYGSNQYGTYSFNLASNSNTAETTDDRPLQASVLATIDSLSGLVKSRQVRTADWKNGIFSDDFTGNNWDAWGQFQIAALARTYQMKVNVDPSSVSVPAVASLLDYAAYAADNFYGIEAYHYLVPGTNNVRTKERITSIVGGGAKYHTNSTQIAYHNASLVAGLRELALAYQVSDRADKIARMETYLNGMKSVVSWFIGNNTSLLDMYDGGGALGGTFRGRGAVFDGITPNSSQIPSINRNTGAESFAEGLWAMVLAKAAIRDFSLDSSFAFETGASSAAAPAVSSSVFDYNASQPTLRFGFNQDVGASLHAFDFSVLNTQSNQVVPSQFLSLGYNAALRQLSITFPGYPVGVLPDGDYHVTIRSTGVVGNFGNPMAADYPFDFFVLGGDADRDRDVDENDLAILSSNWQQSPRNWSQGDFDYNGLVDVNDLGILAASWQKVLAPAAPTKFRSPQNAKAARKSLVDDLFEQSPMATSN